MMPKGEIVTSPIHVAVNEQLRWELIGCSPQASAVPTDIFVISAGEPSRREITKIGDLAYWPVTREWPTARDGRPACFLGPISFADSRDLAGELPGEILAVFDRGDALRDLDDEDLHFEWVTPGTGTLLDSAPRAGESPPAVYGVIHRTNDSPNVPSVRQERRRPGLLAVLQATKIGGVPPWTQPPTEMPGRYIATLGFVHPTAGI